MCQYEKRSVTLTRENSKLKFIKSKQQYNIIQFIYFFCNVNFLETVNSGLPFDGKRKVAFIFTFLYH